MEKNKNHELDVVVALLVHLEPPAMMADPVLTLPVLYLSLRGSSVQIRGAISEPLCWSWGPY